MAEITPGPVLSQIKTWANAHPATIFALLRFFKPIIATDKLAVVTRYDDVQEVLARDDIFQVTYQAKMEKVTTGENFFLGMQNSPQYTHDVAMMRLAIRREDLPRIASFVGQTAQQLLNAPEVRSAGKLDIVPQLTKLVPTLLVGDYFGTPGWDGAQFAAANSDMFAYLFYPDDPFSEKIALAGAAQVRSYLDQTIASRKQSLQDGAPDIDDVIGRCLKLQQSGTPGVNDLAIRNNLIGMLIGLIPTTSKCAVLCLDYLLSNPALLAGAQAAARADDDALVNQYVLESLRFNSFGPGLLRLCVQDYEVAAGNWRSTTIKAGSMVFVATQSAMLDGRKLPAPNEFRLDRPAWSYMHYGYGLHTCFGQYINSVQIAGIVKALLKCKNLRRAPGSAGQMQMEGLFPEHMVLEFDPA